VNNFRGHQIKIQVTLFCKPLIINTKKIIVSHSNALTYNQGDTGRVGKIAGTAHSNLIVQLRVAIAERGFRLELGMGVIPANQ